MGIQMDLGMWVILGAIVVFYLRMAQLRGRRKRLEREAIVRSTSKKGKQAAVLVKDKNTPPFQVTSWVLVTIAVLLMLVGIAAREWAVFPQLMRDYWWVLTAGGVLVFVACFKA